MKRVTAAGCAAVAMMVFTLACSGSGGSSSSPTAPTVAAPAGCSGRAVPQVEVSFSGRAVAGHTESTGILIQLFGEAFNQQIASDETFRITRTVVPCNYEITGQMLGRSLDVRFGLTSPFESRAAGVEKGSVVIDEGPNGVFGPAETACVVRFNASGGPNAPSPPFNIKIRFRVATSNAVDDRGGGCG